jgi:ArsR family transcriptional regulator
MADVFKCFGHPLRLRILEMLVSSDEVSVSEFLQALGVEPSHLSHQLTALRHQRLIAADRRGNQVFYRLTATEVIDVLAVGRSIITGMATRADHFIRANALRPTAADSTSHRPTPAASPVPLRDIAPSADGEGLIA